jgi:hypothetical protein
MATNLSVGANATCSAREDREVRRQRRRIRLANGIVRIQGPVNQFDDGRNEERQVGNDDAQEEDVARFSVQPTVVNDGESDGNVERYPDETANQFRYHYRKV